MSQESASSASAFGPFLKPDERILLYHEAMCQQYRESDLIASFFMRVIVMNQPTVHVERDDMIAKFWLEPVRLQSSGGFSRLELSRIHRILTRQQKELLEAWNAYFRS